VNKRGGIIGIHALSGAARIKKDEERF